MPRGPIERSLTFAHNPTFTGQSKFADGTAAAPSIAFASEPTSGMGRVSSNLLGVSVASAYRVGFDASGIVIGSPFSLRWLSNNVGLGSADLILTRDAANTLAQRNGTNAQAFRVYNTYTDASNYERAAFVWASNVLDIQTEKAGTGTSRDLGFGTNGIRAWKISGSNGHFLAQTDNTYDIGASEATRPRDVYIGNDITVGRDGSFSRWVAVNPDIGGLYLNGFAFVRSSASGVIRLTNENDNDFNRLQLGGTTSAFPAIKRSGARLDFRLADDSADAAIAVGLILGSNGINTSHPTAGIGYSTGAGGAVTQATSKATGVTLNTVTGNITTTADALAADAAVSFTLTDSAIAATDLVAVSHHSGGTAGAYTLTAQAAAGSAVVTIRNVTAGALSEALVIKFAVIKGATA